MTGRDALFFVLGAAFGGLVMWCVTEKKARDEAAKEEKEIEVEVKDVTEKPKEEKKPEEPAPATAEKKEEAKEDNFFKEQETSTIDGYSGMTREQMIDYANFLSKYRHNETPEEAEANLNRKPEAIPMDSLAYADWREERLLYFAGDETVTTEEREIIANYHSLLGTVLEDQHFDAGDMADIYIANYQLHTVYIVEYRDGFGLTYD